MPMRFWFDRVAHEYRLLAEPRNVALVYFFHPPIVSGNPLPNLILSQSHHVPERNSLFRPC